MRLSWDKIIIDDLNRWPFIAVVFLIAAAYFFSIFDLAFISQGNLWRYGHGDPGQHLIGFLYFVQDEWRFPLFHTQSLGYPHGTNIIFTDSIPLLALIFKILAPIVPDGFHPFGLWIFICFLLLAHAFGSLLYHFGHRGLLAAVASALFAVMTPFFMVRIGMQHAALCGQFLVVYALLLYFKVADGQKQRRTFLLFALLLVAALLTHLYLFIMVAAIYGCAVVNATIHPDRSWRELGIGVVGTVAAVAAIILVAGYMSVPMIPPGEFGRFSMNLLAPVLPNYESFLFYGRVDATGGQYEGYNYWGVGIILLLCAGAPGLWKNARSLFSQRLWPLILGFLPLALLAVSNEIYLGQRQILAYDLPGPLTFLTQFRSSGRFFWVISYAVMALAILKGLSLRPRWVAATLVLGAVALQIADTRPIRITLRKIVNATEAQTISGDRWRPIVASHELVALLPSAQCGGLRQLYPEIGRIAAESQVALHSVVAASYGVAAPESCRALLRDVLRSGFRPGVLYILDNQVWLSIRQRPELSKFCSKLEGRALCTLQRAELNLPPLPEDEGPALWPSITEPLNPLELVEFFGIGWSSGDQTGVWSLGYQSELLFRLPSCLAATNLRINIFPFVVPEGQTVTVSANGGSPVTRSYSDRKNDDLVIPIGACDPLDPIVAVTFFVEKPLSPLETGESGDARPLGVLLLEAELLQ